MQSLTRTAVALLPPTVAEKIAAGEVIERPASVIKELVENSLDAGASEIEVRVTDGGKALIEVLDNGTGMSREDLALCIQRHATSKIHVLDDLERIRTLGFRGEALPSVAAVSRLTIRTRALDRDAAFEWPGLREVPAGQFLGSAHGTLIRAERLFEHVPARLKFLKSGRAEVAAIREILERLALTHSEVGFRFVSDDRELLKLRPTSEAERVETLIASEVGQHPLKFAETRSPGLVLRLYWLQGLSLASSRGVFQVVNHRALRDRLLHQAMLSPFRQLLLPGQFPALALFVEIDPAHLDVNVHPTKTEVRFLDSQRLFREVQFLGEELIAREGAARVFTGTTTPAPQSETFSFGAPTHSHLGSRTGFHPAPAREQTSSQTPEAQIFSQAPYLGSLFQTYLLFDLGTELGVIDQHAAHERIRYERLRSNFLKRASTETQSLLIPQTVRVNPETLDAILRAELGENLKQLGFEWELFGDQTLALRGIPPLWGEEDFGPRFLSLLDRLQTQQSLTHGLWDESIFEALAMQACRSSIKAGDSVDLYRALSLVRDLFECENPWNCPHGRPTVVRIARGRWEEWFERRV